MCNSYKENQIEICSAFSYKSISNIFSDLTELSKLKSTILPHLLAIALFSPPFSRISTA